MCSSDEYFMTHAIELAKQGLGSVSPNPMVGAVVVYNGEIIGEGWHQNYGGPHAEVNAIESVTLGSEILSKSTIYVTLEPCCHWGKTPPCCELIISKKIQRVVVGCVDPYHEVCGAGILSMKAVGIDVIVGVLEKECQELNKRFFTVQTKNRPFVVLKWAETSDGFVDVQRPENTPPAWMTGTECRKIVHRWRSEEDAIMVGRKTVMMDNPSLTVRDVVGKNPIRITMDRKLQLNPRSAIFDNSAPTVLFTDESNRVEARRIYRNNKSVSVESIDYDEDILRQILNVLKNKRLHSIIVEGGTILLQSFINANLWDEARVFISPMTSSELYPSITHPIGIAAPELYPSITHPIGIAAPELYSPIGHPTGVAAPEINSSVLTESTMIGDVELRYYRNT